MCLIEISTWITRFIRNAAATAQSALVCIATKGVHTKQQRDISQKQERKKYTEWNYLQNAITKFGLAIFRREKKIVLIENISCNVSGYLAYYWFRDLCSTNTNNKKMHHTSIQRNNKKKRVKFNVDNFPASNKCCVIINSS